MRLIRRRALIDRHRRFADWSKGSPSVSPSASVPEMPVTLVVTEQPTERQQEEQREEQHMPARHQEDQGRNDEPVQGESHLLILFQR
jgi:hypothetical protein